ncbi:hypothetical protein SDC9_175839 [bioreactor metagenome]|uniref:Uncharacterized protein n=1 Tax=bioreactor metagenome TaxID=1076179 RepID=A0A645GNA4_9ZZZZ
MRVVRRYEIVEHTRRAGGQYSIGANVVLERIRYTRKVVYRLAGSKFFVGFLGKLERELFGCCYIALNARFDRFHAFEHRFGDLNGRDLFFSEHIAQRVRGQFIKRHHLPPSLDNLRHYETRAVNFGRI